MKKSTIVLFAFFSLLFVSNIFSQDQSIELKTHSRLDTFDLSKYVLPDLKYKSLQLSFDLNSTNSTRYYSKKIGTLNIAGSGSLSSYCYKNNKKFQSFGNAYFYVSPEFRKFEYTKNNLEFDRTIFDTHLNFNRDIKYFYKTKKFLGLNFNTNGKIYSIKYSKDIESYYNYKYYYFNISPGFSYGIGRIEDVTNAWNTITFLKDFARLNILDHNPTDIEIMEIAKVVSEIRKTRFFDSRLRKIAEFKAVDKVLKDNNLINKDGIEYFASLNDMYYANRFRRFAGSTFSIGFIPSYGLYKNLISHSEIFHHAGLGLKLEYVKRKPINMFWQFDTKYSVLASYFSGLRNDNLFSTGFINLIPQISMSLSYFPSTRTYFNSDINLRLITTVYDDRYYSYDDNNFVLIWENTVNYYLSPRVRLNGVLDLLYGVDDYTNFRNYGDLLNLSYFQSVQINDYRAGFGYEFKVKFNYAIF